MSIDSETVDRVFTELYPQMVTALQQACISAEEADGDRGSIAIGVARAIAATIATTTVVSFPAGMEAEMAETMLTSVREKIDATDWTAWRASLFAPSH